MSLVSKATHKEYQSYSLKEAMALYRFIRVLREDAEAGCNAPYHADAFIKHAETNRRIIHGIIHPAMGELAQDVKIPANIIFWVYRGCTAMGRVCPIELPHICKAPSDEGERFFVTTKQEWAAHREATVSAGSMVKISDHAKLNYLSRVMGVDVDALLNDFPSKQLLGKGKVLDDGRTEHLIGDHVYLTAGNICVTVLHKGMVTT